MSKENQTSNLSATLLAIAAVIGAITPIAIKIMDYAKEGTQQETTLSDAQKTEIEDSNPATTVTLDDPIVQAPESKGPIFLPEKPIDKAGQQFELNESPVAIPAIVAEEQVLVIDIPAVSGGEPEVPELIAEKAEIVFVEPKYEMLRKGYVVAEERYLSFDDSKYRLYTREANDTKSVVEITDNQGKSLFKQEMTIPSYATATFQGNTYRIKLLGTETRLIRSNIAFYNIEKLVE